MTLFFMTTASCAWFMKILLLLLLKY